MREVNIYSLFVLLFYSYDGDVFRNHPNSKNGHTESTLANSNEAPLAVGGYSGSDYTSKAEIFNITTNTWAELADYPHHPG